MIHSTIVSPTQLNSPVMSVPPNCYFLGVSPNCARTGLDRAKRCGSSMAEVKVTASRDHVAGAEPTRQQLRPVRPLGA